MAEQVTVLAGRDCARAMATAPIGHGHVLELYEDVTGYLSLCVRDAGNQVIEDMRLAPVEYLDPVARALSLMAARLRGELV